jgi:hypothetical protein
MYFGGANANISTIYCGKCVKSTPTRYIAAGTLKNEKNFFGVENSST